MHTDKFLAFLESLTTDDNKLLIEAITEGYNSIFEATFGNPDEFRFRSNANTLESKVSKIVDGLQIKAERRNEPYAIDDLDGIVGAYKVGNTTKALQLFERLPNELKSSPLGNQLADLLYA
jgi:hypothetical protein